jgi:predicted MFS family arabinose efflux permease
VTATTANASDASRAGEGYETGYGSKAYRSYVLTALLFVYILNFVDRGLLSVVGPVLKPELGINDTLFGLLTGAGFAVVYTLIGIPVARIAERHHRVWLMSGCIALWSLMTALCGLSREITIGGIVIGATWVLLACRIGVGIGESGCTPPATSLISDYYPPSKRSTALGYYAMGVTLGTVAANLIGGPVAEHFGWRMAFFVVGLPGILVAIVLKLTVKEPPRGYTDPPGAVKTERSTFAEGMKVLLSKPSFWWMTFGVTFASFCGYGIATFQSIFVNRSFDLSTQDAALFVNVPVYVASALGTLATGWMAERMINKHPNAIAWLPGWGLILSVPFYILAFTTRNFAWCLAGLVIGGFVKYGYLAAQYTIAQGVVSVRVRATSTAVLIFMQNMIGYSLGPLFIGAVSDVLFKMKVADLGMPDMTRKMCEARDLAATLSQAQRDVCAVAHPDSLQQSMLITSLLYAAAGFGLLMACRTLQRDLVGQKATPAAA